MLLEVSLLVLFLFSMVTPLEHFATLWKVCTSKSLECHEMTGSLASTDWIDWNHHFGIHLATSANKYVAYYLAVDTGHQNQLRNSLLLACKQTLQ